MNSYVVLVPTKDLRLFMDHVNYELSRYVRRFVK